VSTYDSTLSHHAHRTRTTLRPPPGEYVVEASITDLESGSTVQRRQAISIQPSTSTELFLGRPLLEARTDEGNFEPVVRLHMPARSDSLRASVHLFNLDSTTPAEVVMRLLSFRSDTTVASPPFWISPTRASLQYRGVDYGTTDTVQVSRRRLEPVDRTAMVQFELPRLSPGIYRLELEARSGQDEVQRRHRVLSVKNASFPSMSALDDLIDALTYIAFDDEIEYILDARDPMERKRRFDAFWGSLVTNRNLAANLIRLYYERIEEANLFFTAYKEGWKTDRGMIYTILGPPIYIDERVDVEIWHYSYGDRDPANTFVFERAIRHGNDPFENYILQRRPYYQYEWSRAVDRWREGEVLRSGGTSGPCDIQPTFSRSPASSSCRDAAVQRSSPIRRRIERRPTSPAHPTSTWMRLPACPKAGRDSISISPSRTPRLSTSSRGRAIAPPTMPMCAFRRPERARRSTRKRGRIRCCRRAMNRHKASVARSASNASIFQRGRTRSRFLSRMPRAVRQLCGGRW